MEKIKIENHTKFSLELIFSEADKMATHILNSISENRNKSFLLFAFITSIFSYSFIKIIELEFYYIILLAGSIISLLFLRKNLFPQKISFNGALPENMINSYFDSFKDEELDKEYLATQIESYNNAMNRNREQMSKMVDRFKKSAIILLVSFLLFGLIFLFIFIESLPS
ncbi:hypothetical protein [Winogradskyella sp. A2]|uniref:hypothetical protein n=1 Tax=Winogradskyella sp. A2 TaxID=3366944 RepID=UPI00398C6F22